MLEVKINLTKNIFELLITVAMSLRNIVKQNNKKENILVLVITLWMDVRFSI